MKAKPLRPIRIDGDVAYITLTKGFEALIDAADAAFAGRWNWHVTVQKSGHAYVGRTEWVDGHNKHFSLHRELMGASGDMHIDHISGDGLDNRRANMRECTPSQNAANKIASRLNRLGRKGVIQDGGRYRAGIKKDGVKYDLGYFATPEEASAAYAGASKVLFGAFSRT